MAFSYLSYNPDMIISEKGFWCSAPPSYEDAFRDLELSLGVFSCTEGTFYNASCDPVGPASSADDCFVPSGPGRVECRYCHVELNMEQGTLSRHKKTDRHRQACGDNGPVLQCPKCQKVFKSNRASSLKRHLDDGACPG